MQCDHRNYVQSSRRRQHLTKIPVILYKGKGRAVAAGASLVNDSPITLSIANGHCGNVKSAKCCSSKGQQAEDLNAKLVEDHQHSDEEGGACHGDVDMINSTMIGSLGQNLKAASLYLFKPFRDKKPQSTPHNESCAICLDDFQVDEELRLLPCKHAFHVCCLGDSCGSSDGTICIHCIFRVSVVLL